MRENVSDIEIARNLLSGANFKKLLIQKKVTKYRISKDTGISYRTLCYWQAGKMRASDESALLIGKYLGILGKDYDQIFLLKKQVEKIQSEIDRISG